MALPLAPLPSAAPRRRPGRGRLAWFAALGAVALVVGSVAFAPARPTAWARVDEPSFRATQSNFYVTDIESGEAPGSWLVGGYTVSPDGTRFPTVWSSPDGYSWDAAALPVEVAWRNSARVSDIVRRGDVVVASGGVPGREGDEEPVVWRRQGGGAWTFVGGDHGNPFGGDGVQVGARLGSGPSGFFLVVVEKGEESSTLAVWRSDEGASWERVPTDEGAFQGSVTVLDVAVGPTGAVVAGAVSRDERSSEPRLWITDGATLQTVFTPLLSVGQGVVSTVEAVGDGFVATAQVVRDDTGEPATAVLRNDGGAWVVAVSPPGGPHPLPPMAHHGLAADAGLVHLLALDDAMPRLWTSPDAEVWTEVRLPEDMIVAAPLEAQRLAVSDGRILISLAGGNQDALWLGEPDGDWANVSAFSRAFPLPGSIVNVDGVAGSGGRFVAIGGRSEFVTAGDGSTTAALWRSPDGREWTPVPEAGATFAYAELHALTGDGSGFVAVGTSMAGEAPRATAWHSDDGLEWRPTPIEKAVSAATAVARKDGRTVIVGAVVEDGASNAVAAAWTSEDGSSWVRTNLGEGVATSLCVGAQHWMAVGLDTVGGPAVWEARDGRDWDVTVAPDVAGGQLTGCALAGNGEAVAVGATGHADGVVWHRGAGTWELVRGAFEIRNPPRTVTAVIAVEGGYVATGTESQSGQLDLGVWTSPDGRDWTRVPRTESLFDEAGLQEGVAILVSGGTTLVVGRDGLGGGAWLGPAPPIG